MKESNYCLLLLDFFSWQPPLGLGSSPHRLVKLHTQSILQHRSGLSLQSGWLPTQDAGKILHRTPHSLQYFCWSIALAPKLISPRTLFSMSKTNLDNPPTYKCCTSYITGPLDLGSIFALCLAGGDAALSWWPAALHRWKPPGIWLYCKSGILPKWLGTLTIGKWLIDINLHQQVMLIMSLCFLCLGDNLCLFVSTVHWDICSDGEGDRPAAAGIWLWAVRERTPRWS